MITPLLSILIPFATIIGVLATMDGFNRFSSSTYNPKEKFCSGRFSQLRVVAYSILKTMNIGWKFMAEGVHKNNHSR